MINFKELIAKEISKNVDLDEKNIMEFIEIPPSKEMGDYAFPCFKLAKTLRKSPAQIAKELGEKVKFENNEISKIKVEGGYLNFFVNRELLTKEVLTDFNNSNELYGSESKKDKTILVEYSSPNIAKNFHIGHLRTTIIGAALYNIYKFLGYNAIGINHLGDYGTQFGKLIEGYKRWGTEYNVEEDPIPELTKIYVRISDLCKEDEEVLEACRENFKKLEEGDEYCVKLWTWFRDVSLKEFQKIYDLLGVKFDSIKGESFYSDKMDEIENILDKAGVLTDSQGARVVNLDDKGLGVCIIRKSDGSTIYATRDLAAIKYRADTYNFDKCLYVVAYEQSLHFKQIFEVAKYLGIPEKCVKGLKHVQYGMTRLPSGKMSTRNGTVIEVKDLLHEAITRIEKIIDEKNPDMKDKKENAKKIGIGAVIFNNLCNTLIKDQIFDWDTVLSFQGETGPYIQYVYVRCKSVLNKFEKIPQFSDIDFSCLMDDSSQKVISNLYNFNNVLNNVIEKNETSYLTHYLIELGQNYTEFYNNNKVLVDDEKLKNSRGYLSYAVQTVIKIGAKLLGIDMPTEM